MRALPTAPKRRWWQRPSSEQAQCQHLHADPLPKGPGGYCWSCHTHLTATPYTFNGPDGPHRIVPAPALQKMVERIAELED